MSNHRLFQSDAVSPPRTPLVRIVVRARLAVQQRAVTKRPSPANDTGLALLSAIFFMVLVAGLSVVVLSVILSQSAPALVAQKNTRTVYSAQAGLQTALGLIRNAADAATPAGQVFGDPAKLPCAFDGEVSGDGAVVSTRYEVTIDYFETDPTDQTPAWRANLANQLACSSSAGVAVTPRYAFIQSAGRDLPIIEHASNYGDRALSAVYKFKVSNVNIEGGRVFTQGGSHCLQVSNLNQNTKIRFRPAAECSAEDQNTIDRQSWVYTAGYQLKLAADIPGHSSGLCITGPEAGKDATLQPCESGTGRWSQLWSWTGAYSWMGQKNPISDGPSNLCLSTDGLSGSDLTNQTLRVRNGCQGQFAPSSQVGAGAASYGTKQIVNYEEFGRCADVTGENINESFMISYPCKQDPTGSGVNLLWNHKWIYSEPTAPAFELGPQQIYVNLNDSTSDRYCLTPSSASGVSDLVFRSCNLTDATQNWTRVQDTGTYTNSYVFKDHQGRCMFTDKSSLFSGWSKVRVTPSCDGSLAQKWNAPPTYVESTFGGYREIPG